MNHSFKVSVSPEDALAFAKLSGDWNPLHTDPAYAANTEYRTPVLHGAFSSGLISRMAGMYLPGKECLLQNMNLRFVRPIIPPTTLKVSGELKTNSLDHGRVEVSITDDHTGTRYVEASYEFAKHQHANTSKVEQRSSKKKSGGKKNTIMITGASGGIGRALIKRLGDRSTGLSRKEIPGLVCVPELEKIEETHSFTDIDAIVHCAWPQPDNQRLLETDLTGPVEVHLDQPLRQMITLAKLLERNGKKDAVLVLLGSTFAKPGRHHFRMPLYSLSKSLIPTLTRILALELARHERRCVALVLDIVDGGMNAGLNARTKLTHADRVPSGKLPTPGDVADQIVWILNNRSHLMSGATITLTGGALP